MRKEQIITTNNNQMEEKGMKSRFIHFKKRFVPAVSGALMGVMLMSTTCFAAGTSDWCKTGGDNAYPSYSVTCGTYAIQCAGA